MLSRNQKNSQPNTQPKKQKQKLPFKYGKAWIQFVKCDPKNKNPSFVRKQQKNKNKTKGKNQKSKHLLSLSLSLSSQLTHLLTSNNQNKRKYNNKKKERKKERISDAMMRVTKLITTDPSYDNRPRKQPICDSLFWILCENCGEFLTDFVWGARIWCFGGCERRNTKQK